MPYPLTRLNRCKLFHLISEMVWWRISRAHEVKADLNEVGLTADIIVEILQFNKTYKRNFTVFARPGWNEDLYGSDIDIFIEVLKDQFLWFALQAKILKKNGRYTTFRDTSSSTMQWEKLNLLEAVSGCRAYFLLYNGHTSYKAMLHDRCRNVFNEEQYGCSLVEPKTIESLAVTKAGTRYVNPTFHDIHPKHAQPWRVLTCCNAWHVAQRLYSREEIIASNQYLIPIEEDIYSDEKTGETTDFLKQQSDNPITFACVESGWRPRLRILINQNESVA